ncbi:MAG TPA: hypothetical protein VFJ64_06410 [Solirubrobacterales bacterium]|nr:hypothetical protein [Solirubrobacterales bacterium]
MKGPKTLTAVLLGFALLASAVPASASATAYKHYVACGVTEAAKPAHQCSKKSKKGAFFMSLNADVNYSVCVKFPTGKHICAKSQPAKQGILYFNKITSNIPGRHQVSWFVEGKRVGVFNFTIPG